MVRKVIGVVDRRGVCLKSDDEIIRCALMARTRALERLLQKKTMASDEFKKLQDEYERTFALTERYRKY